MREIPVLLLTKKATIQTYPCIAYSVTIEVREIPFLLLTNKVPTSQPPTHPPTVIYDVIRTTG